MPSIWDVTEGYWMRRPDDPSDKDSSRRQICVWTKVDARYAKVSEIYIFFHQATDGFMLPTSLIKRETETKGRHIIHSERLHALC